MNTMKPFTREDWYALQGATKFEDGSEPLVGTYKNMVVVVDNYGLQAWLEDEMGNPILGPVSFVLPNCFKEVALSAANKLLDVVSNMTESQLQECFKQYIDACSYIGKEPIFRVW